MALWKPKWSSWHDCITSGEKIFTQTLAVNKIVRIFAGSFGGIRRKDDNLYDLQGRFEPQTKTSHHSRVVALLFEVGFCGTVMQY